MYTKIPFLFVFIMFFTLSGCTRECSSVKEVLLCSNGTCRIQLKDNTRSSVSGPVLPGDIITRIRISSENKTPWILDDGGYCQQECTPKSCDTR